MYRTIYNDILYIYMGGSRHKFNVDRKVYNKRIADFKYWQSHAQALNGDNFILFVTYWDKETKIH